MNVSFDIESLDDLVSAETMLASLRGAFGAPATPDIIDTAPEPTAPTGTDDPRIGVELDANGTPWIDGIHATTKAKTTDGRWKKRRGVDDPQMEAAEAEARAKLAGTPQPTVPTEPVVAFDMPTVETVAPATMQDLTNVYSAAIEAGIATPQTVTQMYERHGCPNVADIATNETARAGVVAELRKMLAENDAATGQGPI